MPPGNSWADATAGAPGIRHRLRGEPDWRTRRRLARPPRAVIQRTWSTTIATKTSRCRGLNSSSAAQRSEQIPPLGLLGGAETEPVRQPLPVLDVQPHARVPPRRRPIFADTSKMTNLYAQVLNRLSYWNCPILAVRASSASGAAWYARSSRSGPEIRNRGARPPHLTAGDAHQQLIQPRQRRLRLRTCAGQGVVGLADRGGLAVAPSDGVRALATVPGIGQAAVRPPSTAKIAP
jgi:hypothetical protein